VVRTSTATVLVGCTVSHYKFLSLIGTGGNGEVYLAEDQRLHRQVAVKVLSPHLLTDARARRRFRQEALTLSRLNHTNIATIHDFESSGDRDLLVMEYVPGETLNDRIERGPLSEMEAVDLGTQLLQGLAAAHRQGIIHRDLKPRNLRVGPDGHLKILDYGLAQFTAPASDLTTHTGGASGSPFEGTPVYMAPEQIRGLPADERSDLYAAGEVLFEMATGQRPFQAPNMFGLIDQVLNQPAPSPRTINPALSSHLDSVVLKALQKDPGQRYHHADDFEADLRGLMTQPPRRSLKKAAALLGALALLVAAGLGAWRFTSSKAAVPVLAFGPRDWVLVADATGGEQPSGQAMREALTLALQQSRYINVLPRDRVVAGLRRMEKPPSAPVVDATALDLCRRENAKIVLSPTIETIPGGWRLAVRALDASGRLVFMRQSDIGSRSRMLAALDTLAGEVRRALGESVTQIAGTRPLAQVTTPSTEALERYSRAIDQIVQGNLSEAEASLRAALVLDPEFAMAHFHLARVFLRRGLAAEERQHLEAAYLRRERLTDRERHQIEATYYDNQEDYDKAEQTLRTLVGLYPDDANARYELGLGLASNGKPVEAAKQLGEAVRIDPFLSPAYSRLILTLMESNQSEQALSVFDQAAQRNLATPELRWGRALALFGLDRLSEARREFDALAASPQQSEQVIGRLYANRLLIYEGRFATADSALDQSVRSDRLSNNTYPERVGLYLLGRLALLRGHRAEALARARDMTSGEDVKVEHLHHAGHLQVLAGDLPAAEATLQRLAAISKERPNAFTRSCTIQLQAGIAALRGRDAQAADLLKEADAAYPGYHAHVGLAELAEKHSDWRAAADEWRQVTGARGDILRHGFPADFILARLQLARASARLGLIADARASYDFVLATWQRGDMTPIRRQALDESSHLSDRRLR
jgi:tetratricopeptide (TPR) repeat protein/tRNA A-37 threonylcarbamoyl transferase component Bud32